MRRIPTRLHGMMDYAGGAFLIVSPWLFGFNDDKPATWAVIGVAIVILVQSLLTDYELGVARRIPMRVHLMMDTLAGAFLIASPWLLGFADEVWVPHLVFGIAEMGAAKMTRTEPDEASLTSTRTATA